MLQAELTGSSRIPSFPGKTKKQSQLWVDAWNNGDGELRADGSINGV